MASSNWARSSPVREGVTNNSKLGSTSRDTTKAKKIITAVSTPKMENMGIGAVAITRKPVIDVTAEIARAPPVPSPARRRAGNLLGSPSNSWRNRTVKWVA